MRREHVDLARNPKQPCIVINDLPNPAVDARLAKAAGQKTALFAAGCFWGIEAVNVAGPRESSHKGAAAHSRQVVTRLVGLAIHTA